MTLRCFSLLALAIWLLVTGCGPSGRDNGTIVVGVTSELRVGVDIDRMHVVMRAGGEVLSDKVIDDVSGQLRFPAEFTFDDLEAGTHVEIDLEALPASGASAPLVVRSASTEVVGGEKRLLQLRLETECVARQGMAVCAPPDTCITGACSDIHVPSQQLEPYADTWGSSEPDVCKPAGAGAPIVIVGGGQGDYLPLEDDQEVQVEAGPQGGHHIWIAIRLKNLKQSGSITSISGFIPELRQIVSPFNVIFTFNPDEGGFCKLAGLRFQLDTDNDIHQLLGKTVDVEVKVKDPQGASGTGKRTVTLSQTIL